MYKIYTEQQKDSGTCDKEKSVIFVHTGKAKKWETNLSADGQSAFKILRRHLRETDGTLRGRFWSGFGKLNQLKNSPYHCHLNHDEVAVWQIDKSGPEIKCTFSYIGSRKDAPY